MMNSVIDLITVLIIFLFVLALTYYVTRWIAGYQKTKTSQGNLAVTEAIRVSNNQYIQIVRAKDQMTLLTTLTAEELKELPQPVEHTSGIGQNFADILEELKKKHGK